MREAALRRALAPAELALTGAAVLGAAVFSATAAYGRSALFWPSERWAGAFAATLGCEGALWWLATRAVAGHGWRRWHAAAWPFLAALPAAGAAAALYLDDRSNHLVAAGESTKSELVVYLLGIFLVAQAGYWLAALARARRPLRRRLDTGGVALIALALAAAAYFQACVFDPWVPRQTDLGMNLVATRELLAGVVPYHLEVPQWADRIHLLPVTLALLMGPLTLLPDSLARLVFFLTNQALWLAGVGILVWRFVSRRRRAFAMALALAFGATYWPWRESISFGQQDGLLLLLFVLSITAIARSQETMAGIALGLTVPVKPISIWLPLIYLMYGRWRALLLAGVTAIVLVVCTLPWTGLAPWIVYVRDQLPDMVSGTVRGTNIPLMSEHARFFVGREALGGGDPAPSFAIIQALNLAADALGLLVVAHLYVRPRERDQAARTRAWLLDASLGLTLTLLLAPYAWQHYATWLTFTFLVLALPATWQPLGAAARVASALLGATGFLLLSLDDSRLIDYLRPLVERWPGAMAFYTAGLFCVAGAVLIARLAPRAEVAAATAATAERQPVDTSAGAPSGGALAPASAPVAPVAV